MSLQERKFVLYEYLLFFWRKKWLFVIIPLLTALAIASLVYTMKVDSRYKGEALVFTGGVNSPDLTHPLNIQAEFDKLELENHVFVAEKGHVKFTIKGNKESEVKKELKIFTDRYLGLLLEDYNSRLNASKKQIAFLDERIPVLEESRDLYLNKMEIADLPVDEYSEAAELLLKTEDTLTESSDRRHRMISDLEFFEKPRVLKSEVTPAKTYIPESIATGIFLGLMLTVALLVLFKYIGDARRYYHHD